MGELKTIEDFFLDELRDTLDKVMDSFFSDHGSLFDNHSERLGFYFKAINEKLSEWQKSKKCVYRGCKKGSIKKSHTITRGLFLSAIAENGHVYTPAPNYKTSLPQIKKIGINNASTFPGFCVEHEKLFFDFESTGNFNCSADILKQIYRTICREIIVKEFRLTMITHLCKTYESFRNKHLLLELKKYPIIKLIETKSQVIDFKYGGKDVILTYFKTEISDLKRDICDFKKMFFNKIHDELEQRIDEEYFCGFNFLIEEQLPIALAGRGNFKISNDSNSKPITVELILNVLPTEKATNIFIFSLKENEDAISSYLSYFLKQDFGIINMVESWMIHGSDHWFLKPTIWEKILPKHRTMIVNSIADVSHNIGSNFSKTIFNDIKRGKFPDIKKLKSGKEFAEFIAVENEKFTDMV